MYVKIQKTQNNQNNLDLKKKKVGEFTLADFKSSYKAIVNKKSVVLA